MVQIPCHCGNIIEADIESNIDLSQKPEIYKDIIEGDFMSFTCPECGFVVKAETSLHLTYSQKGLNISFLPEADRSSYYTGRIKTDSSRVVIGYRELVEKILVYGADLDDRVIEIIKFRLLQKAETESANIYFSSLDNESIIFHIYGLKPDKVGVTKIPVDIYKSIEQQLEQLLEDEDIKLFTDGPYVSVNRIYLED